MKKALLIACSTALAALLLSAAPAFADTQSLSNPAPIAIPGSGTSGPGSPYPSPVSVSGMTGPITDVKVILHRVGHAYPKDMQVVLVSPNGNAVILMNGNCGTSPIEDFTWTFSDDAPEAMGDGPCDGFVYRPSQTDFEPLPTGPPVAAYTTTLGSFDGGQASGTWDLYVIDRANPGTGDIEGGWTLTVTTGAVDAEIPGTGTSGPAGAYPISQTVSGETGLLTDVDVVIDGLWHQRPTISTCCWSAPRASRWC